MKATIIGGGFGGLSAAALLAKHGMDVTLLEKNDVVGGRARAWHEDGFVFDMGPSWYLMPEVFERFFEEMGTKRSDYYDLQLLDPFYRVFFSPDERVDINADLDQTRRVFESFEPDGARKLDAYLQQAKYKYDIAMNEFLYREYRSIGQFLNRRLLVEGTRLNVFSTLDKFVSRYFSDRRAKQILEYAMVFLGTSPQNAPALYSIMSHVDLNLGVYFPRGGMAALVDGMRRLAEDAGATINTNQPVTKIEVANRQAHLVRTDTDEFPTDLVITNADYHFADTQLLDAQHRSYSDRYWNSRVLAPTMFVVYLGLSKKLQSVAHHNLYFTDPWNQHFDTIFKNPAWPENPSYYVSCASYDDEAVAPAGKENIFFLVPVAPGLQDTDSLRETYADTVIRHFEQLTGEQITPHIQIRRIFSHRDFQNDYNAFKGTALGLAHTLRQTAVFRPSHRSKRVKNLFYSGQYTHPGIGVPMTLISSQVIAEQIVKEYA